MSLRRSLIRLAYVNPGPVQEALLSLLTKTGSSTRLRLYHGTSAKHISSIRSKGLTSKNYEQAQWYVVATDFASALFHASPDMGQDAVVVEFEIKVDREPWYGWPHLWPPHKRGAQSSWFALKTPLGPRTIKKVHRVPFAEFSAQKSRGF